MKHFCSETWWFWREFLTKSHRHPPGTISQRMVAAYDFWLLIETAEEDSPAVLRQGCAKSFPICWTRSHPTQQEKGQLWGRAIEAMMICQSREVRWPERNHFRMRTSQSPRKFHRPIPLGRGCWNSASAAFRLLFQGTGGAALFASPTLHHRGEWTRCATDGVVPWWLSLHRTGDWKLHQGADVSLAVVGVW